MDKSQSGKQQFEGIVKILGAGRAYDGTMSKEKSGGNEGMSVYSIYFSPTGGTAKVMDIVADVWKADAQIDLSVFCLLYTSRCV